MNLDTSAAGVHAFAAEIFWRYAETVGVQPANATVIASDGRCLLAHDFADDLFDFYPVGTLSPEDRKAFFDAVRREAVDHCQAEQNMLGQIYVEDMDAGRSPSAASLDTAPLRAIPTCSYSGELERIGKLCLRHPLPAITFASREPKKSLIQVSDTATALGFDLPMFMAVNTVQLVTEGLFIYAGVFFIPVPSVAVGEKWGRIIQNSTRQVQQAVFVTAAGTETVKFIW